MNEAAPTTNAAVITGPQLRAMVTRFLDDPGGARLLVVGADPASPLDERLETDRGPVPVVRGTSVLAVRVAMVDHPDGPLVIVTDLSMRQLGSEVAAQGWRGRVETPSPWNAVLSLFRASELDPQLRSHRWMVDLLVQHAPANRGYPRASGGVLTIEDAWSALHRHLLGLTRTDPTTADLVRWVASDIAGPALDRLDESARSHVARELARRAGPAAPALLTLARRHRPEDVVPLGLVVDALWPAPDPVAAALLRAKQLDDHDLSDAAAADWGAATVELARRLEIVDPAALAGHLQRAEALLQDVQGTPHAVSRWLPSGLTTRVRAAGHALAAAAADPTTAAIRAAERATDQLAEHRDVSADRLRLCRAAVRLLRRTAMRGPADVGGDLTELTWRYLDDGGWVDAAREHLAVGDTDPALADVARQLLADLDHERQARDRAFAAAVAAQATATAPEASLANHRPLRIEDLLSTVVAPLTALGPTLLLVIDGLSHAASVPLLADLRDIGWRAHGYEGRRLPGVLSALPSKTVCSRATLLSGRLTTGGPQVEAANFTGHTALREASGEQPPLLFHKERLRQDTGRAEVVAELADPDRRLVGVVFNGVDDFLGDLDQLRLVDGLAGLPPLAELLNAALQAGRTVVLTSDHGHTLEGDRYVAGSGGGERYRLAGDTPPGDGEVELAGPRVLDGDGRIIAAADGHNRYNPAAKRGYHGGATPGEVLCPLIVLASEQAHLPGWEPLPVATPGWWDPDQAPVDLPEAVPPPPAVPASPQPGLFDEPEPAAPVGAARPGWIDELLASPLLASQRKLAGRTSADDATLATVLQVLVAAGGTASGATLERSLETTPVRLRGRLNGVRSLLDVDGYPVLRIEADNTAQLDLLRLAEQFDLDIPEGTS